MSERTLLAAAGVVLALSLLLFLAPLLGIIIVAVAALGVPALLFLDHRTSSLRDRAVRRASGSRRRAQYAGRVSVGEEGAADYDYRRRAS